MIIVNEIDFSRGLVQVPTAWLFDTELSLAARGLLVALMARERENGEPTVEALVLEGQGGRDEFLSALDELRSTGYLACLEGMKGGVVL